MAVKKRTGTVRFPKYKILEDKRWNDIEYVILDAVLNNEDEYTVEEAAAKITEYMSREV